MSGKRKGRPVSVSPITGDLAHRESVDGERKRTASRLATTEQGVDYRRRKAGYRSTWRRGPVPQDTCRYGHTMANCYVVQRSTGRLERRCRTCKSRQNAQRRDGGR